MNTSSKNQLNFFFLSFLAILAFSFIVLYPSFNLAFQDDDWQGVVLPKTNYTSHKLLSPYGIQFWYVDTLYTLIGPNFFFYYILGFILRNFAAFSVLIFLYLLTKNRLASFLGGLMVAVGFTGLQTTFEIANMNVFVAIIGYLIFLCTFFLNQEKVSFKNAVVMGLSLFLSSWVTPVRTYPLYVWIVIVDIIGVLMNFKRNRIKFFFIRQLVILLVFLLLYLLGIFSWYSRDISPENRTNNLSKFISEGTSFLSSLDANIVLNFLRGLGNIIIPDILDKSGAISVLSGSVFLIGLIGLFIFIVKRRSEKIFPLFAFLFWVPLFYASYFIVYINGYDSKDTVIVESYRRYLLPPFIGFSVSLGILLSLAVKKKNKIRNILLIFTIVLVFIHGVTTHNYLSKLSKVRDGPYMVKIWNQIKQLVPESSLDTKKMNVFYFETDGTGRAIYTVNDGFIGHAIAVYKIDSKPSKFDKVEISSFGRLLAPPIITFEELVSYIEKSLSGNPQPDIWNRVFALRVEGDRVTDIKKDVKKRVEQSLNR